MQHSKPVDGFRIAYERTGSGPPVVLLHGWPGHHRDFRAVLPLLLEHADVVAVDLRGFGESDKYPEPPADAYSAAAQARSVVGLIEELGLRDPVIAGYDVGSRVTQAIAQTWPDLPRGIVISPPVPGAGERVLTAEAQREFWYQAFHQLDLVEQIIDGDRASIRAYLGHFWSHWSGPSFELRESDLDALADLYSPPGAFTASVAWYRAGSGTVARSLAEASLPSGDPIGTHTTILWPECDPLFPTEWSDRVETYFGNATVIALADVGHFVPLEAPDDLASAIRSTFAEPPTRARSRSRVANSANAQPPSTTPVRTPQQHAARTHMR